MKLQTLSSESSINKEVGYHQDLNRQNPTLYFFIPTIQEKGKQNKIYKYILLPFTKLGKHCLTYIYLQKESEKVGHYYYVMYSDQSSHYRKVCTVQFKTCWFKFKDCHYHNYNKPGFSHHKYHWHNHTYQIGCLKRYAHAEAHKKVIFPSVMIFNANIFRIWICK